MDLALEDELILARKLSEVVSILVFMDLALEG